MQYSEIKHDYIWGPLVEPVRADAYESSILAGISIDTWKTDNEDEASSVVANVILTRHGDMVADFHDNSVRANEQVLSHILAAKEALGKLWEEHLAKSRMSDRQAAASASADEEGVCPLCGAEIKYSGPHDIDDDGGTIPWECPNCEATGKEGYNRVFDQHYNVCDAAGNPAPGRESNS